MKEQLTSLDVYWLVKEIKCVEGGIVRKVYELKDAGGIILQIYLPGKGTQELFLGLNFFCLLNYSLPKPEVPPAFAMLLRKHLKGKKIKRIYQKGLDRIIIIEIDEYKIICELLPKPNIFFVGKTKEKDNFIWSCLVKQNLKFRNLKIHSEYVFPESSKDLREISKEEFVSDLKTKFVDETISKILAKEFSLGGIYAEEVCLRAEIDPKKKCKEISSEEAEEIIEAYKNIFSESKPSIIKKGEEFVDVVPIKMISYERKGFSFSFFETFNDAINEYFVSRFKEKEKEKTIKGKSKYSLKERLEHRLMTQMKALEEYKRKEEKFRKAGEIIYLHYSFFEDLLEKLKCMDKTKILSISYIKKFSPTTKEIIVNKDNIDVPLFLDKTIHEAASFCFEQAKKMKKKVKRLEKEIEKTKKEIEEAEKIEEEELKETEEKIRKKEKKEKKWFEKFRWFETSNGLLFVMGKDATTNEVLIKKYMETHDLVFHADYQGSPFGILKQGRKIDLENNYDVLVECAEFLASFSKAWKNKVSALKVFFVYPEQVTKKTKAGEYLRKGSFMIYGQKNWLRAELKLSVGVIKKGDSDEYKLVILPTNTAVKKTKKYVVIKPGDLKPKELAMSIINYLYPFLSSEEKEWIKSVNLNDLIQMLPPGGGNVEKRRV